MAGRAPQRAVENFLAPIQLALSCVTTAQIDRTGNYNITAAHAWALGGGEAVLLPRQVGPALRARLSQNYRIVQAKGQLGPWKVKTTAYFYTLDAADGRELLSYQWHPTGVSAFHDPHLHFGDAADVRLPELRDGHLPTGRVPLELFIRLLIEMFNVRARRPDWKDVLFVTRRKFDQWRTWE